MFKRFLPYLLVLLVLLVPAMAFAADTATLRPQDGSVWTLYVYGNGPVVAQIMESIKLLMVPAAGDSGFNTLMMFLATVGFLVMAVQAGFDPGKNLLKMFSYILVIAAVHITTMQILSDIDINDPVKGSPPLRVTGVPALVGVPAAIVSQVGHWFSKSIETNFSLPDPAFALSSSGGGTFNLFGRMMQESNEYVISQPELKKSLSAYVADCVVPAMANGSISATELTNSPNMTNVLSRAVHNAILTKYWPAGVVDASSSNGYAYPTTLTYGSETYDVQGGLGAVVTCRAAWSWLQNDLTQHADDLMNSSAAAWSKTGVLVPFAEGMKAVMAQAASGGANPFANYSTPQGFILQQAMLNTMNGSFRQAAAAIGNNEALMAASIAQAEQSQKSSWFTAARVFSNMMGYVYTTLQAFIFAIVPVVILALMVPGLGRSIFTNYAQILVWLTLWQPMLSIVNFLIMLFGQSQIGSTLDTAGGITMSNRWAFQESTNDLMLAAQFLGTSVPLLTWGLVKGSMAFTEFISHGIGSSMAQQAGATAATGNVSMGNMSMDNTSMNKFNTAMSSAVGFQTTMGYTGSAQTVEDGGGHVLQAMGSTVAVQNSKQLSDAEKVSYNKAIGATKSAGDTLNELHNLTKSNGFDITNQKQMQLARSAIEKLSLGAQHAEDAGDTQKAEALRQQAADIGTSLVQQASSKMSLGAGTPGISPIKASVGFDWSSANGRSEAFKYMENLSRGGGVTAGTKDGTSRGTGIDNTAGRTNTANSSQGNSTGYRQDWGRSTANSISNALNATNSIASGLEYSLSHGRNISGADRASWNQYEELRASGQRLEQTVPANIASGTAQTNAATAGMPQPTAEELAKKEAAVRAAAAASPGGRAAALTSKDQVLQAPADDRAAVPPGGVDATGAYEQQRAQAQAAIDKAKLATGEQGATAAELERQKAQLRETTAPVDPTPLTRDGDSFTQGNMQQPRVPGQK
jgi:hypothetical protein